MASIHQRLGAENIEKLVDTFYDYVLQDEKINHLFTTDIDLVKKKQYMFLTQFLGGPGLYVAEYGHPKMRLRHMPHRITEEAAISWLRNMRKAIWSLDISETLKIELFNRFPATAAHMVNT